MDASASSTSRALAIKRVLQPRIVLVEDAPERIAQFKGWLEGTPFVLVCATSGGQALGLIKHGAEGVAGICLDHDLNTAPKTPTDSLVSGTHVVSAILNKVKRSIPILVHSMSPVQGERMAARLQIAGFSTTRIRMVDLNETRFKSWLDEATDSWDFDVR